MSEFFSPVAHHHNALVVRRPSQILDGSGDGLELVLEDVLAVDRIPDAHLAGLVGRGYVESAR